MYKKPRVPVAALVALTVVISMAAGFLIKGHDTPSMPADQKFADENGYRTVVSVYPALRNGQWVMFLARDGSRREAFVHCGRRIVPNETIRVTGAQPRWRSTVYFAMCQNPLPGKHSGSPFMSFAPDQRTYI